MVPTGWAWVARTFEQYQHHFDVPTPDLTDGAFWNIGYLEHNMRGPNLGDEWTRHSRLDPWANMQNDWPMIPGFRDVRFATPALGAVKDTMSGKSRLITVLNATQVANPL